MPPIYPAPEQWNILIAARHDATRNNFNRQDALICCLRSVQVSLDHEKATDNNNRISAVITLIDDYSPTPLENLLPADLSFIRVVRNQNSPGQAGALNFGIQQFPAEIYVFTDSDCIVSPNWITTFKEHYLSHPQLDGVTGPNWLFQEPMTVWKRFLTQQESRLAEFINRSYIHANTQTTTRIDCRSLTLRKEFITRCFSSEPLFPENAGPSVSGQASAKIRALPITKTAQIGFEPKAVVFHRAVGSLRSQISAYYHWGRYGNYNTIYTNGYANLFNAFAHKYFYRHFIAPSRYNRVSPLYLWSVHAAFWAGIFLKSRYPDT